MINGWVKRKGISGSKCKKKFSVFINTENVMLMKSLKVFVEC